jgi:hypothetical protein
MKEQELCGEGESARANQHVNGCQDATAAALVQQVVLLARVVFPEIHARNT